MTAVSSQAGPRAGAAVLGSPIAHSLSPVLHLAAYAAAGLTGWTYRAVECDEASLPETLRALDAAGLAGVSLTMPLKRAVLPWLTRVDRLAADVAAANTVLFGGIAGEWWGGNTDVAGMVAALRGAGAGAMADAATRPLILGAGATAASAVAALAELGTRAVTVAARRPAAVAELAQVAARFGVEVTAAAGSDPLPASGLVVSTLPARAADPLSERLPSEVDGLLFDVVYAGWPTPLAAAWQARGGRVVGGLELLVQQAALQVRLMTGHDADIPAMRSAGEQALAEAASRLR